MLTTPATASVPYRAAAPSVTMSMRSIAMAGSSNCTFPVGTRLPSISSSVARGPRPRKLKLVIWLVEPWMELMTPVPLLKVRFWITFARLIVPSASRSSAVNCTTGEAAAIPSLRRM